MPNEGAGGDLSEVVTRERGSRLTVVHVHKVTGIGGAERHLLALLPALARAGIDIHVCSLVAANGDAFTSKLRALGLDSVAMPAGPDANPLAVARVARYLHKLRPDLVHTHLIHGDFHGQLAARIVGVPAVSSVHGTPSFYRRDPVRQMGRLVGALAACRVAISDHVRRFLLELGLARPDRLRVIPYGLDAAPWRHAAARRSLERRRLQLAEGDVAVGIASRLIEGKGHQVLLDALIRARVEVPALRLLVAGDGPLRPALESAARSDVGDSVSFLGFVEDMQSFTAACDVFVFPTEASLGEGFGLAALEAMAAGLPVLATSVGSIPEVVTEETGMLVASGSSDELAQGLVRLGRNEELRRRLGEQAAIRAERLFSMEQMVSSTMDLYADTCR